MQDYRSIWTYLFKTAHRLDYADVKGIRTRYIAAGSPDKPPLVLLHGTGGSIENFAANYATFAEHFHVIALDMIGCGWTDRPDYPYSATLCARHVRDFLDVLNIPSAAFVGVSLGSWVAARLAMDYPGSVERLVMVAPAGIVPDQAIFDDYVAGMRSRRMKAAGEPTWDSVRNVFNALFLDPDKIIDDLVAVRLAIYKSPDMAQAMKHIMETAVGRDFLTEDEWRGFAVPILAIRAADHLDMFATNAEKIGEWAPDARVVDIHGTNHWAQFEQPDRFHELTIPFLLEQTDSAR